MKKNNVKSIGLEELLKQISPKFGRFMLWQKVKTWLVIILPILLITSVSYNVYQSVHFKNEVKGIVDRAVKIYAEDINKEREAGDNKYNEVVVKYNELLAVAKKLEVKANRFDDLFNMTARYGNRHCYYLKNTDEISCSSY